MISAILFVCYFSLLLFLFNKGTKKMDVQLSAWQITAIFSFRVLLGCLYGYVFLKYYGGDDPWMFFEDSIGEKTKLIHHPLAFFSDFSPGSAFREGNNFWEGLAFYRRNLEYFTMVKMLAVFDLLSGNNFYIDTLFFEFTIAWGPVLLFKLLNQAFPGHKTALLIIVFFIPTFHFWLAGIRAEGLLLLFMALILYYSNRWFNKKNIADFTRVLLAGICFTIYRSQFLLVFFPAFFCWTLCKRQPEKSTIRFIIIYLACMIVFFGGMWVSPQKNLAVPIVDTQHRFMQLHAKTRLPMDSLEATPSSFLKQLPRAFANTMIQPTINRANGLLQQITALEIMAFWALVIAWLFFRQPDWKKTISHPLILLFVFYGISQILLIGYTVPFPGAIIRYKSIPILFLVISIGLSIDWNRIYKLFK